MKRRTRILAGCAIMLVAAAVFTTTAVRALIYNPSPEAAPSAEMAAVAAAIQAASPGLHPARVVIPAIDVDAKTEDLGVTPGGAMMMPSSFSTVGWYKYGVMPGQTGTAVMYAHYDNGLGLDGVFKHLNELQAGDVVDVVSDDGRTLRFTIDSTAIYPYKEVPPDALGQETLDSGAHLTLITCTGKWVYDAEEGMTYDHRLVVFATLSSTTPAQ